ncbi:MAG: hypothetical protein LBJ93_00935 [Clostridiales bacterium]|jgi:hypothetical protein|nr:hypothetical protein [Clostridiales bacterium]
MTEENSEIQLIDLENEKQEEEMQYFYRIQREELDKLRYNERKYGIIMFSLGSALVTSLGLGFYFKILEKNLFKILNNLPKSTPDYAEVWWKIYKSSKIDYFLASYLSFVAAGILLIAVISIITQYLIIRRDEIQKRKSEYENDL